VTTRARAVALALATAVPLAAAAPASLCAAEETAYFECAMASGKELAVCGALPDRLQYRFGRPGAVELAYPGAPEEGTKALLIARYHRYRTDRLALRFEREGVGYTVFDDQEDDRRRGGVEVRTADARIHELVCIGTVTSRLRELVGVVACDRESALAGGSCP
jgi:hypothetical protein